MVWLKAAAIRPSVSAQSAGNRTEKSPSRNAIIAERICRERASGESYVTPTPDFDLAALPLRRVATDGDFSSTIGGVKSFIGHQKS